MLMATCGMCTCPHEHTWTYDHIDHTVIKQSAIGPRILQPSVGHVNRRVSPAFAGPFDTYLAAIDSVTTVVSSLGTPCCIVKWVRLGGERRWKGEPGHRNHRESCDTQPPDIQNVLMQKERNLRLMGCPEHVCMRRGNTRGLDFETVYAWRFDVLCARQTLPRVWHGCVGGM
jgi:hypothetical protein